MLLTFWTPHYPTSNSIQVSCIGQWDLTDQREIMYRWVWHSGGPEVDQNVGMSNYVW